MSEPANTPAASTPQADPSAAAPAAPQTTTDQKPDFLAPKFAALTKKERQIRQQAQAFKAQQAEFERQRQDFERQRQEWESEFKERPLDALKKRGRSYEDLTNAALEGGKFKPEVEVKDLRSEIEKLRQEQAEKERKQAESAKASQEQAEKEAVDNFKTGISEHITANKDKYELTALYDASEQVFATVEEHFTRTKRVLSIDEACQLVESYLESELERTAKESKKFQSKYGAAKPAEPDKGGGKSTTTLSNALNSSAAPILTSPKVDSDRMRRALEKLG